MAGASERPKAIDCWLNPTTRPAEPRPPLLVRGARDHLHRPQNERFYSPPTPKAMGPALPISVNPGTPGPPMPAEPQRPLHLDEVCLFYPELKLIMAHGADPWWGEAIRLLLKYPNLYMMTSAYAPKYLPQELIHFMNTRGAHKILFASDHPFLSFERCLAEAAALPLREGVLAKYLRDNALALFRWD